LFDEFGDGWNGAVLHVNHSQPRPKPGPPSRQNTKTPHPSSHRTYAFQPSSTSPSSQTHTICASLDEDRSYERGQYFIEFVTSSYDSLEEIPFHWEVGFQISTKSQNFQNVVIAGISTRIVLEFTAVGVFEFKTIHQPKNETKSCQHCPRPVRPSPPSSPSQPSELEEGEKKEKGRPTTGIPLTLQMTKGDNWFMNQVHPTRYVISDASKLTILLSGMMCSRETIEVCEISLEDGDYYFRVGHETGTATVDDDKDLGISWTFCGTHGSTREEISFSVVGGHCRLGHHVTLQTILESIEETMVTLEGVLFIENIFTSDLSISDQRVLELGLADTLQLNHDAITLIDICQCRSGGPCCENERSYPPPHKKLTSFSEYQLESQTPSTTTTTSSGRRSKSDNMNRDMDMLLSRQLSPTYSYQVTFLIKVKVEEDSGGAYVGTQYKHIWRLIGDIKDQFDSSLQGGLLQSTIRLQSNRHDVSALQFIRFSELTSLFVTAVNYQYTPRTSAPSLSPFLSGDSVATVLLVVMDESKQQELLVAIPFLFIIGAFLIVFFLSSRWMTSANSNSTTGECETTVVSSCSPTAVEDVDQFVETSLQSIPGDIIGPRYVAHGPWAPERIPLSTLSFPLTQL
jgi:hypothetical protein